MPKKCDQDAKDLIVRLVEDYILAENPSMQAACHTIAPKLEGSRGTRHVNGYSTPTVMELYTHTEEHINADNARLRRDNQQLRDTNELLKAASGFFASELNPKPQT